MAELSERFVAGLKDYNLTKEELNASGWKYCGGDEAAGLNHYNYFKTIFGGEPEACVEDYPAIKCICGHTIHRNFFICNKEEDELLIIGSECINKFITKKGRSCEKCGDPHRNRKDNLCNNCRSKRRGRRGYFKPYWSSW
tara:strand:+ start:78 stop:497 length:420 start_codon:yes stop_codon:yes gene_type:complete